MVVYVLPAYNRTGTRLEIPLVAGALGYLHVVGQNAAALDVEIPNSPEEDPPVGRFRFVRADASEGFIDFQPEGGIVTGGELIVLAGWINQVIDTGAREIMAQVGDTPIVAFDVKDKVPVGSLAGATLSVLLERADGTTITRTGTISATIATRIEAQLLLGDVQSAGTWRTQAEITFAGGGKFRTRPRSFEVLHNVAAP